MPVDSSLASGPLEAACDADALGMRAIAAMADGRWHDAARGWEALYAQGSLTLEQCHACARVYERLQWWERHEALLNAATERFPLEASLRLRQTYRRAALCVESGAFEKAQPLFEEVHAGSFEHWPPALNFLRWELKIGLALMPMQTAAERRAWLETGLLFKAGEVYPQRIAGFRAVVAEMSWDDVARLGFLSCVGSLAKVIMAYDQPVRFIKDEELLPAVRAVAEFWASHDQALIGLPCAYLEFFTRLFISFGYLSLYEAARAQWVERLPLQLGALREPLHFAYAISWANEQQMPERYGEVVRALAHASCQLYLEPCVSLSAFYHAVEAPAFRRSAMDGDFEAYVRGRSVAIVGPVDVGLRSGPEIDDFDVVIRFNHHVGVKYDPDVFGSKTQVSYYQRTLFEKYSQQALSDAFSQLEFAVVDAYSWARYPWLRTAGCRVRERLNVWFYQENPMLLGNPYAIPRVIFDVLRFRPRRMKVFGANLYTSMSYLPGYCERGSMSERGFDIFKTWSVHDPLSNFLMMKHFFMHGHVECDDVLVRLLSLKPGEYVDRLRQRYGEVRVGQHAGELDAPA